MIYYRTTEANRARRCVLYMAHKIEEAKEEKKPRNLAVPKISP